MGLLGDIFSASDSLKRRVKGLLADPVGSLQQSVDNALPTQYEAQHGLLAMRGLPNNQYAAQSGDKKLEDIALNFNPAAITVWHGTPHKFAPTAKNPLGEFDLGKIGTGEGAQAYGHGVYVAEAPEVAKSYIPAKSSFSDELKKLADSAATKEEKEVFDMYRSNYMPTTVGYVISKVADAKKVEAMQKANQQALDVLMGNKSGALYKVDLPDEHLSRFLDWDKPLSQQTQDVQKALLAADKLKFGKDKETLKQWVDLVGNDAMPMRQTGQDLITIESNQVGGSSAMSEYLRQQGLLGIRYLDQGSRGFNVDLTVKGKPYASNKFSTMDQAQRYAAEKQAEGFGANINQTGTSNFVVFDPSILNILERQ